jgi:crotonobetainyl-CoA:carnitine CoA-transferase CaiB-like acyl-CoA transferase
MEKNKVTKLPVVHVLPSLAQETEAGFGQQKLAQVNALLAKFGVPVSPVRS